MTDFMDMAGSEQERKISRYEYRQDGVIVAIVDTCEVWDSDEPYETAISHLSYNPGRWAIVEMYQTKKDAQVGHNRWIEKVTADKLGDSIEDISTSTTVKLAKASGVQLVYERKCNED